MSTADVKHAKIDALARFADSGPTRLNCAQSVLHFGLLILGDDPDLAVTARYFGGGMCRTGEACGALTGALLALGLRDYRLPDHGSDRATPTSAALQQLLGDFTDRFGTRRCCELTGYDISTDAGFEEFKRSPAHEKCADYVSWVCDRLALML